MILNDWSTGDFRTKWNSASKGRKTMRLSKEESTALVYISK
jgi:hypothetical protein